MSGTSMDGIDAALVDTDGTPDKIETLHTFSHQYQPVFISLLKATEFAVRQAKGNASLVNTQFDILVARYLQEQLVLTTSEIERQKSIFADYLQVEFPITFDAVIKESTRLHANAVNQLLSLSEYSPQQIDVIGYHGQTLYHQPNNQVSVVIGDGSSLAKQLGIKVVNDFRREDMLAGGQGAPFAPIYHHALAIKHHQLPLAVVNCGGIANVTIIPDDNEHHMIAYDSGPGNALIDSLVRQRTKAKEHMDRDGQYGLAGEVDPEVLSELFNNAVTQDKKNYLLMPPPKSLDYGDLHLLSSLNLLSLNDAAATLAAFTANTIVNSLDFVDIPLPKTWVLAGGGWFNPVIRRAFEQRLAERLGKDINIQTADDIGWNNQSMEAEIFAYLAVRRLNNLPLSYPGTTNVPQATTGGTIHLASSN